MQVGGLRVCARVQRARHRHEGPRGFTCVGVFLRHAPEDQLGLDQFRLCRDVLDREELVIVPARHTAVFTGFGFVVPADCAFQVDHAFQTEQVDRGARELDPEPRRLPALAGNVVNGKCFGDRILYASGLSGALGFIHSHLACFGAFELLDLRFFALRGRFGIDCQPWG